LPRLAAQSPQPLCVWAVGNVPEFSLRFVRPLCPPDHQDLIYVETDRRALAELKPFRLLGFR
jgi:hypothetical protein